MSAETDRAAFKQWRRNSVTPFPSFEEAFLAGLAHARAESSEITDALRRVVAEWVNPADGAEFENGEVPALDQARAVLAKVQI